MDGKYIKAAFKGFLVMAAIAMIVLAVIFGVYYYNRKNFEDRDHIRLEKERCEALVAQGGAKDLVDYSQCKLFLEWLNSNTNFND